MKSESSTTSPVARRQFVPRGAGSKASITGGGVKGSRPATLVNRYKGFDGYHAAGEFVPLANAPILFAVGEANQ